MKRALIFTAKSTETTAVLMQLTGLEKASRHTKSYVYDVYKLRKTVTNTTKISDLDVALFETGRGQDNVMPPVKDIVGHFNPDIVIYIGCAGGEAKHTNIGDVFIPLKAWPYEKGKESKGRFTPRAHPLEPNDYLLGLAAGIAKRKGWRSRLPDCAEPDVKVVFGDVASGNKILADEEGRFWKLAKSINDDIVAVETECYAFFKAMQGLHRPYVMIRGISDNLSNKSTLGKAVDDDRQKKATAAAAAFAAQMLREFKFGNLRDARGLDGSNVEHTRLKGYWTSTWHYGKEVCQDLLHIEDIDTQGKVVGHRCSLMPKYQYVFVVSGVVYGTTMHLTAIPVSNDVSISTSLILTPGDHFQTRLTGIAIRPLGTKKPLPDLGKDVVRHGDAMWASSVTYDKVENPRKDVAKLWSIMKNKIE